jgi:UDP-glucose 4-epimerase
VNILVTGGCGFIGSALIRSLAASGHVLRIVDNLSVGSADSLGGGLALVTIEPLRIQPFQAGTVQLAVTDIADGEHALAMATGADAIIHLAANTGVEPSVLDPHKDCRQNVIGTLNYLEAARHAGVKRFVFASSGAPLGAQEPPIHERLAPRPASPYGASKLAGEGYCSAYFQSFGVETVALRFGNIFGPGSNHKSSIVAKFTRLALAGQRLEIYGDGEQTRDFIYLDDIVAALTAALDRPGIGGEVFQIASGQERNVNELVRILLPILGEAGIHDVEVVSASPRIGDSRRSYFETTKARERLGWHNRVSLEEGLKRTVSWFVAQARGNLPGA